MSSEGAWVAFHLHYHEDLDRLLLGLVRPLIDDLLAAQRVDRFFFVRFALGGKHLRLRLQCREGQAPAVRDLITTRAEAFFRSCPSTRSMPAEEIQRINQSILATDPGEREDVIVPDNCVLERPFVPETERYGGAALLPCSLEYFARSSGRALRFLEALGGAPRARQLPLILRMLLGEALGFSACGDDLLWLLSQPFEGQHDAMKVFIERGDRLFEERRETFIPLVKGDMSALAAGAATPALAALDLSVAARALAAAARPAGEAVARRIAASQVHMSANRLGLLNPEEVYLERVLWRAVREIGAQDPSLWERISAPRTSG
jgi:hypothetical protein